jgi:hypothetical protein
MSPVEIIIIIAAAAIVIGSIAAAVVRKKKGKTSCDCGSCGQSDCPARKGLYKDKGKN